MRRSLTLFLTGGLLLLGSLALASGASAALTTSSTAAAAISASGRRCAGRAWSRNPNRISRMPGSANSIVAIDKDSILHPLEQALRSLCWAVIVLAIALAMVQFPPW